jgi:hypothetical protein
MTTALETAYASNTDTPLDTLEFLHSALPGGALRFVRGYYAIEATLEDASTVTFEPAGFAVVLPERGVNGAQNLDIQFDDVSQAVWQSLNAVITANRTTQEKTFCIYRPYLEADLSAPAGASYKLLVTSSVVNRNSASFRASWAPIPDISWPRLRYYPTIYPGVKYAK